MCQVQWMVLRMILKNITVEFHEQWGQGFRFFNGWVYYMSAGSEYKFYEILPTEHHHKLLTTIPKDRVKKITEKVY